MSKPSNFLLVFIVGCLIITGAACNDDDEYDKTSDLEILKGMEADIDTYIGDTECDSAEDCRALPFGNKPCGGPWSYKIFSISSTDSVELDGMIKSYFEFNGVLNERYGWSSDCMYVTPPEVDCVEGHCVAVTPSKQGDP